MLMTAGELRRHIQTDKEDGALEAMLRALESSVKGHTNNDFVRVLKENGGEYPADIKMGVVKLVEWSLGTGKKTGIASETISRHAVTYVDQTASNTLMGYPASLLGFLEPYMRARFGQGVGV